MKIITIPLMAALVLLTACGGDKEAKTSSLETFLSIHDKYCEAPEYKSSIDLVNALHKDPQFKTIKSHEGIFEHVASNVSFAITPEEEGCTTDLKLKNKPAERSYFDFDEFNLALQEKGYRPRGEKRIIQEIGMNNKELRVIEQKYLSPNNVESVLVFPIEQQDQYYMTFFAETFNYRRVNFETGSKIFEI
ncbi:MAG: Unknown protein [uncultured Thiotrichaceae bacterium]|uniref:Lipoprotein n=1 Tax=uncultured Thiotrichaceae bacterium TaxID=298394 RepID=A0A6S6SB03_9GAMM|nr:MAG: Unknown protein [uncultured Thiotrichaceae bacterium]